MFRIARRVAKDRVISTVDPDTRHGHKTSARGFDGYKGHTAVDPDSEIITATTVTPGNAGDASVAEDLIADLLGDQPGQAEPKPAEPKPAGPEVAGPEVGESKPAGTGVAESSAGEDASRRPSTATTPTAPGRSTTGSARPGSRTAARPRHPPRRADCSARTASTSTSTPAR